MTTFSRAYFPALAASLGEAVADILDPPLCAACGMEPAEKHSLCGKCLDSIPLPSPPLCPLCGGENDGLFDACLECLKMDRPWSKGVAVARMDGLMASLIRRLKYGGETAIARALGSLAAEKWLEAGIDADLAVPMPAHWTRKILRGFNQADLTATVFSRLSNIPLRRPLKRIKPTPKQAGLDRAARLRNLENAFTARGSALSGKTVVLLDDVMTTGATMSAAANALLEAGAEKVVALSLARA